MPRTDRPPAFQFYPGDFASDGKVEAMSTEAVGAYILLICKAWEETPACTIPNDNRILARWARLPLDRWEAIREEVLAAWSRTKDGARYLQPRLSDELQKQISRRKALAEQGAKGAESRWHGHGQTKAEPSPSYSRAMPWPMATDGLSSSSSSSEEKTPLPPTGGRRLTPREARKAEERARAKAREEAEDRRSVEKLDKLRREREEFQARQAARP